MATVSNKHLPQMGLGTVGQPKQGSDRPAPDGTYSGVLVRRIVAHIIDNLIVLAIVAALALALALMSVITLGLMTGPVVGLGAIVPIVYFAALTGGRQSATPGMRLMAIELRTLAGGRPDHVVAALRTLLYFATIVLLTPLVLIVVLFSDRRRALHDILSGTVVDRKTADSRGF
jgi:uncharacterized RDD family membrane protein YckC